MTAPPPPPAAEGPLGALTERLRARLGVEPGARELAEALWLAEHVAPAEVTLVEGDLAPDPLDGPTPFPTSPDLAPRLDSTTPTPAPSGDDRTHLYADRPRPAPREGAEQPTPEPDFAPVRIPVATALPNSLALQRALRPLQRYHPPVRTTAHRLDEQATAERAAETGLFTPVLRSGVRRESRMRLLMDASTSTSVWDSTLEELRQICAGLGAFREVQVHYVHQGADGQLAIGTSREPGRGLRAAEQLRDPTGRQLTLVVSDCAGPLWRSGQLQRLLHHWAQAAPVAVVQPLPQRLWRRTHLPALPGTLRRREGLGARLEFRPAEGHVPSGALPVPVLGPTRAALGTWARLLSGGTGLSLPAAAAWVHAAHPAAPPRRERPPAEAGPLVSAFRRSASRQAVSLAVAFSAVPLSLPVMQLVQRAVQPQSGPSVLAEVLLSGLLRRGDAEGWYEFVPGVREELLRLLPRGDALLVLKHCGAYVERHFGRGARNFPALALARLTGDGGALPAAEEGVPEAFAEVSRVVLGRFEAPVEVRREQFAVLYMADDAAWALWVAQVLRDAGCGAELRMWTEVEELPEAFATPALLLLGNGCKVFEVALASLVAGSEQRIVTVEVSTPWPPANWPAGLKPAVSLAGTTARMAGWRLLNTLGVDDPGPRPPVTPVTEFPGPTRMVWGMVPTPSRGYVLREDLLGRMRDKLTTAQGVSAACAVVGPPTSGKTQLAAEYVRRFADDYDFVGWIRARDHNTRRDDVRRFASTLAPHVDVSQLHELFRHLREAGLRWLIVYDGWDDLQDANDLLISGGHVLITTKDGAWAEAVDSLRVSATEEEPTGPATEREELVRRALVRVHAPVGTQGVVAASGFFLAPGWVVTAAHVVAGRDRQSGVGVTTMDGRRHQVERVQDVGELALLHVPDVDGVDCLWLTDRPVAHDGPATLYGAEGPLDAPRVVSTAAAVSGLRNNRDTFLLDGALIPLGSAGGPVIDEHHGSVIGVIKSRRADGGGRGEAVRIEELRALCEEGHTGAELWHGLVRSHDRHHADRFAERGPHLTWTGVQLGMSERLIAAVPPDRRAELYGLLAELEPPIEPKSVLELLGSGERADVPPRHWRDGAGLLNHLATEDRLLLYTARVWAHQATRSGPAQAPALAALRDWTERVTGTDGHEVGAAFSRVDTDFTRIGPAVRVEIEPVGPGTYGWRLALVRSGGDLLLEEGMSGGRGEDLPDRLNRHLVNALLEAETTGAVASVQFFLPSELLWDLPVETWRLSEENSLGRVRNVFVRSHDGQGPSLPEWRRRWDAVARGPLQGLRLHGAGAIDWTMHTPLNAVPLLCRHADGTTPTANLDLAESMGFPLMMWSRAATHTNCADFYERAEDLLSRVGTARELVAQVGYLRLRAAQRDSEADWARHLAVFCDPPPDTPMGPPPSRIDSEPGPP